MAVPPAGVETVRQAGRPAVTTAAAGELLGLTAAQVRQRVDQGLLPGGAEPRPRRPRYYGDCDVPPLLPAASDASSTAQPAEASRLRARVQALETANLLLLASEAEMREAAAASSRADDHPAQAERERAEEVRRVRLADAAKADALSALLLPGNAESAAP